MKITSNILLCLIFILSCKQKDKEANNSSYSKPQVIELKNSAKNEKKHKEVKAKDSIKSFVNSNFSNYPFGFKLDFETLKKIIDVSKFSINKQSKKNVYTNIYDTIYFYERSKNKFIFIKSQKGTFLNYAEIKNSSINLERGIHVGITKKVFFDKIEEEISPLNIVRLMDEEEYSNHKFYFENDSLVKIIISHNVE